MAENWHFIFTILVMAFMLVVLVKEWLDTASAVFGAMVILLFTGIISPKEAFEGFSNQGMLAVGFLYVLAAAVKSTAILDTIGKKLLGVSGKSSEQIRLLRFMFPVAISSGFMNNTPIVAMFIPMLKNWCRRMGFSPSKFLIPLSYASIIGGTITLIGTSTNLVVHGYLISKGYEGLGFFEMSKIGIPLLIVGIPFIAFVTYKMLPNRKDAIVELDEHTREYVVTLTVKENFQFIDRTVEEAGLRHLQGLFLFQIERNGEFLSPVKPIDSVRSGDRLYFTGVPSTIVELQKEDGLQVSGSGDFKISNTRDHHHSIFEVVISSGSRLVGKTVRDTNFRKMFDAAIIAIHRHGERINRKIGDIIIEKGDTLLLLADDSFMETWYNSNEFLLVSENQKIPALPRWKRNLIYTVLVSLILTVTFGLIDMVVAAAIAVSILLFTKTIKFQNAIKSIHWDVLIVIASAIGISSALDNSGITAEIANGIQTIAQNFGTYGIILILLTGTVLYSELITNAAAAAMVIPIAISLSIQLSIDPHILALTVMFGASLAFATPIGYQTNLMVQAPGNYRFKDYLKAGLPLDILMIMMTSLLIYFTTV